MDSPYTLGMDGEFLIYTARGRCISAGETLMHDGPIGTDGTGITWELRTEPSKNIDKIISSLASRINAIPLALAEKEANGCKIVLEGLDAPIGSHIWIEKENSDVLLAVLDLFLGIPAILSCTTESWNYRASSGYGRLFSARVQTTPEGKAATEYRSCPSFWHTPARARSIFTLAAMCVYIAEGLMGQKKDNIMKMHKTIADWALSRIELKTEVMSQIYLQLMNNDFSDMGDISPIITEAIAIGKGLLETRKSAYLDMESWKAPGVPFERARLGKTKTAFKFNDQRLVVAKIMGKTKRGALLIEQEGCEFQDSRLQVFKKLGDTSEDYEVRQERQTMLEVA